MHWHRWIPVSIIGATIALSGCIRSQEAFETVQLCVGDQQGVAALRNTMAAAAQAEDLQFIDNSAQAARGLRAIEADKALERDVSLAIDFHIEGPMGLGVIAANLGLPPYQVGIGFTEGDDAPKAHRLADRLISTLSRRWSVRRLGPSASVLPMKTCDS